MKAILQFVSCLLLFSLLVTGASAFPLSGGNGQVNATVFGVVQTGDLIEVDMALYYRDSGSIIQLIDSDDKIYPTDSNPFDWSASAKGPTQPIFTNYRRETVLFHVPADVILKRIRITPAASEPFSNPFSVDWTGVPEVSDNKTSIKFYGHSSETKSDPYASDLYRKPEKQTFDVKLTNKGNETMEYSGNDFSITDQFGWIFICTNIPTGKLLPGESLRFDVDVDMYKLSRPITLSFRGLKMDISAWA